MLVMMTPDADSAAIDDELLNEKASLRCLHCVILSSAVDLYGIFSRRIVYYLISDSGVDVVQCCV
jgi:hypothetical protein